MHDFVTQPGISAVIPFVALLLMIATGPVLFRHRWEKWYPVLSLGLAAGMMCYYIGWLHDSESVLHTITEYNSFIILLTALFVITGGIHITVEGEAGPFFNVCFLFFGALLANIIGTTGASMLLIRPFIRINRSRIQPVHIVFFIFLVSNIGGALTPIGDPPLFLGFLRGIPFFWIIGHVWYVWLMTVLLLLLVFWLIDREHAQGFASGRPIELLKSVRLSGRNNIVLLGLVIIGIFLDHSVMPFIPVLRPLGLREVVLLTLTVIGYKSSSREVLRLNEFDFEPMKEVAFLFAGIFLTMIPVLQIITAGAKSFGSQLDVSVFFWSSGLLSSVLDNAPTYLNFLSAAMGKYGMDSGSPQQVAAFLAGGARYISAISLACVFFGAMTYIGNGPNFMVRAMSERAGIKMPTFFGFVRRYSLPILIPVFAIIWALFLR